MAAPAGGEPRPRLVYDGRCGFCFYWARYWRKLTGDAVDYQPYQAVAADYPAIAEAEFQRAVQYIAPDGRRASAAEASFVTLSHAPWRGFWLALYRHLPGFAAVSELAYAFIAAHRPAFYWISRLLWGRDHEPPRYDLVSWVFLRLFGLIYLSAFVSFGIEAQGLIGSHGISPLADLVASISGRMGTERFYELPMVFWWDASDRTIQLVWWAGAGLSLLVVVNLLPRLSLILLHVLYLSLLYAGQGFTTFQWDTFLLEAGFAAFLLSLAKTPGIWLLRWLLFRFMFMSGAVKLLSGDPNWWNLSALSYHFLTQPLPTTVAWHAAQLPPGLLRFATGSMFVVELILPFLIFCPRRPRFVAAFGILLLEACIFLTGNYNWFNLQTMLLCLVLFDDAALRKLLPHRLRQLQQPRERRRRPRRAIPIVVSAVCVALFFCSLVRMDERFGGTPPAVTRTIAGWIEPFHLVSAYGLFSVMTTTRHEIVLQGSYDGVEWRDYEFRYKPGDVARPPPWNVPLQPRLDWQMWFAALEKPRPWFLRFLQRLLENEPTVTALLERNPFPGDRPVFIRALFYDYTYATAAEKAKGQWWDRRLLGAYFPAARLKTN